MNYLIENINTAIAKIAECMARDPKRAERLLRDVKKWVGDLATQPVVSAEPAIKLEAKHPDDLAVDSFACAMKDKLALSRVKGRCGWQGCNPADLSRMLREHVEKGDPCDVANFCMFLWNRDQPIADPVTALAAHKPDGGDVEQWMPIETATQDGRTMLLGYFNSHGKWRTVRGQWMSEDYIAEYWEDPDDAGPGWFETSVESDEIPNCWRIEPTHWRPLPALPAAIAQQGKEGR